MRSFLGTYVQKLGTENSWKKISGGHRFGKLDFPGMSISGFLIYRGRKGIVVLDVSVETVHRVMLSYKSFPSNLSSDGERRAFLYFT